ncbi:hypothetical protein H696_01777 [Fonticula alba]|uniref:Peptidase M48 domain-containing protein n=1 Tax=Fonticula alba TaxID=691883 RepID=A0A058ZEK5_FONAL|nr:hypothetical protein H696_01777 [Fonticula alba]KCV72381.1 hypothetical protein H696_01777 [Fonticula alba]|eukprot:XP_009493959.1 hypothetical protein H696_01777 [Fonticula alba]
MSHLSSFFRTVHIHSPGLIGRSAARRFHSPTSAPSQHSPQGNAWGSVFGGQSVHPSPPNPGAARPMGGAPPRYQPPPPHLRQMGRPPGGPSAGAPSGSRPSHGRPGGGSGGGAGRPGWPGHSGRHGQPTPPAQPSGSKFLYLGLAAALALVMSLDRVTETGRVRVNFISPNTMKMIETRVRGAALKDIKGAQLPPNHPFVQQVAQVSKALLVAAQQDPGQWNIVVLDKDVANAFVTPFRDIVIFSGLQEITQDENGLATVIGHEISHYMLDHHAESISMQILSNIARLALAAFDGGALSGTRFFDVLFNLPFSRSCEREADHLGVLLMARACYDPSEASSVWARMRSHEGRLSNSPVAARLGSLLNSHPSSIEREANINSHLPEARFHRKLARCDVSQQTRDGFSRFASSFFSDRPSMFDSSMEAEELRDVSGHIPPLFGQRLKEPKDIYIE